MEKIVQVIKSGKCIGEIAVRLEHSADDGDYAFAAREIIKTDERFEFEDFSKLLFDVAPVVALRTSQRLQRPGTSGALD